MCPHTAISVSIRQHTCSSTTGTSISTHMLTYAICVLIAYVSIRARRLQRAAAICVLIVVYMCPHTAISVSCYCYICAIYLVRRRSPIFLCVRILLYVCLMCPHSAMYVSSYCYTCVLILVYMWCADTGACSRRARMLTYAIRTHIAYVSICVLILVPVVDEHVC
jgi:hypothetical protein